MIRERAERYLCGICREGYVMPAEARLCEDRCLDRVKGDK